MKNFETEKAAEKWARNFDYARRLLSLPLLYVEAQDEAWIVVNPNIDAVPHR